jgi:molybdopterin molybdotransferase
VTTFDDARRIILQQMAPLGPERVPTLAAAGRVLATDCIAPWDMPQWDNSAMDGYAVRTADCADLPVTLAVRGYIPAGETADAPLQPGCAIRIMTGAPIPAGADAVVPVEETEEGDGTVRLLEPVKAGQHIRFRGEDVQAGQVVIPAGTSIRSPQAGMLASMGKGMVAVHRRPTVAIVSTGDELLELGEPPSPGMIINSNSIALAAAVTEAGGIPLVLGIARDNRESHRQILSQGLQADMLVTSAGVSAGDRDLVREVLAELGVRQLFWKVEIKPGRPTAFAMAGRVPVFSLPGNPVSSMITFEQFVRPAILRMTGHRGVFRPLATAVLTHEVRKKPGRLHFHRVVLRHEEGRLLASSSGDQNTGIMTTMVNANAIALLPADRDHFPAGSEVTVQILDRSFEMLPEVTL